MRRLIVGLGVVLLVGLVFVRVLDPYPVRAVRGIYFDTLQRMAPREPHAVPVRVLDIDEAALAAHGQWPWPRNTLAKLLDRLAGYGASVVVFDIIFAEPDRFSPKNLLRSEELRQLIPATDGLPPDLGDNDLAFAEAMTRVPVVLGTARSTHRASEVQPPKAEAFDMGDATAEGAPSLAFRTPIVPPLYEAAGGIGSISVDPTTESGVIRSVPLVWDSPEGPFPSLAVEALRLALGEDGFLLWGVEGERGLFSGIGIGSIDVPTRSDGQIWLHYRQETPEAYVSAASVLEEGQSPELQERLEGHIVFVGTSAVGLHDIRTTALGESVPGVAIHAQIAEQILLGTYLQRTDWVEGLEIIALIGLGLVVAQVMALAGPTISIAAGAVSAGLVLFISWYGFATRGILFDATFPVFGGFAAFSVLAGYQFVIADRDKRQIRRSFSQYVAPTVLQQIEQSGYKLELGGETRPVTVMFCDIQKFTALSETMSAQALVSMLNRLFTTLSRCILEAQGTIDKYIGDSVMAFWNAPLEIPDHPRQACLAALNMRKALTTFNSEADGPDIQIAIGLATGTACVGNVGSVERFDYSAVGETVNLAARVEAACRELSYDIVIAAPTALAAGDLALLRGGSVRLKGVSAPTEIFVLVGDADCAQTPEFAELRQLHDDLLAALATRDGTEMTAPLVQRCQSLGARVEPGLQAFYAAIPGRLDDFRPVA